MPLTGAGKRLPAPGSPQNGRSGAFMFGTAALLWIPQAALLALAVQRLVDGAGLAAMTVPAAAFLALGVARASIEAWGARRLFSTARTHLTSLRAEAASALASRSPLDRNRPLSGQAASVLAEQAEAVLPWLTRYQSTRWRVMIVLPVIALAVAHLSWTAALILIAAAPLIPLFMAIIGWKAKAASEEQLQALGGMNGFLLDRLRGMSTLRALGAVDATARRLRASAESLRQRTMRVLRIAFLSSTALELFASLGVALVAVYVGFHLLGQIEFGTWGRRLRLGEGMFILLLAPAFFEPLRELSAIWHDRAEGEAAQEALDRLRRGGLPLPGGMAMSGTPLPAETLPGTSPSVEIEGLVFRYEGESPLFNGIDFQVRAGEHVALVGASGAGKSTLLSIIAGLVPVAAGTVRIGGIPLDTGSAAALRERMAWIGQKTHVFSGTVRGNVALGRSGVTADSAVAAIRHAGLDLTGNAAPDMYLGEGGTGLSGGELVRLALARAGAVAQADLWLVDEPTAHLDKKTAVSTIQALLNMARGRTLIVATHDPALAAQLDRIIPVGRPTQGAILSAEPRVA